MPESTCKSCPFWHLFETGSAGRGFCKRYPPNRRKNPNGYPVTDHSEWCGEHPVRKVVPAAIFGSAVDETAEDCVGFHGVLLQRGTREAFHAKLRREGGFDRTDEICDRAERLARLMTEHPLTASPPKTAEDDAKIDLDKAEPEFWKPVRKWNEVRETHMPRILRSFKTLSPFYVRDIADLANDAVVSLELALAAANERAEKWKWLATHAYRTPLGEMNPGEPGSYIVEVPVRPGLEGHYDDMVARRTEGDAWRDVSGNGTSDDLPPAGDPASGWRGDDGGEPEGRHD